MSIIPKVLIKKGEVTKDIFTEYGLRVTAFPYLLLNAKPKNIATRTYYDQNGSYVYIPPTVKYEGQDFKVSFVYKGAKDSAGLNVSAFIAFISGAEISIYSEFVKVGRQRCRVMEIADGNLNRYDKKDILSLDITFRTEDPVSNITLTI